MQREASTFTKVLSCRTTTERDAKFALMFSVRCAKCSPFPLLLPTQCYLEATTSVGASVVECVMPRFAFWRPPPEFRCGGVHSCVDSSHHPDNGLHCLQVSWLHCSTHVGGTENDRGTTCFTVFSNGGCWVVLVEMNGKITSIVVPPVTPQKNISCLFLVFRCTTKKIFTRGARKGIT